MSPLPIDLNKLVWHHTTMSNAYKVLDSQELWATDVQMLNDTTEGLEGIKLVKDEWKKVAGGCSQAERSFLRQLLTRAKAEIVQKQWYVACATNQADSLTMWRSYGSDLPCAIALWADAPMTVSLPQSAAGTPPLLRWRKVAYTGDDKARIAKDLLETVLRVRQEDREKPEAERALTLAPWQDPAVGPAAPIVMDTMFLLKHEAFADEREMRLIVEGDLLDGLGAQVRFLPGSFGIAAHVPLTGAANACISGGSAPNTPTLVLPIAAVAVGPCANQSVAKHGLSRFLSAKGHHDVLVFGSEVPFR